MRIDLGGKRALVTGANSGIGEAVARAVSAAGARVAINYLSRPEAAKAGLGMLTRTMAQEAAPHGVRVLALAPGAIQTDINRAVWSDPAMLADLKEKILLGRMGSPEEIARMAVVLLSDAASYLTGTT